MKELLYALAHENAIAPTREPDSVGYDVYAYGDHILNAGDTKIVPVGFHVALNEGYGAFVWDRSSFGSKGIHVFRQLIETPGQFKDVLDTVSLGGCLDFGYRGQLGVILHNMSQRMYQITHGMRMAQIIIQKCELPTPRQITLEELLAIPSHRGQAGFGSSDGQNTAASAQEKIQSAATISEASPPPGRVIDTGTIKETVSPAQSVKAAKK